MYKCFSSHCENKELKEQVIQIETEVRGETYIFSSEAMFCDDCRLSFMNIEQMQKAQNIVRKMMAEKKNVAVCTD